MTIFRQFANRKTGVAALSKMGFGSSLFLVMFVASGLFLFAALQEGFFTAFIVCMVIALIVIGMFRWAHYVEKQAAKIYRFAYMNRLAFRYQEKGAPYQGIIFSDGHTKQLDEALTFEDGSELGNYHYVTGSGKSRQVHNWSYVRVPLERNMPHMVLDAKGNNFLNTSNLPEGLSRDQKLSLEGDFDDYFTLYAPKEYEQDALYVFTPDLMQLLIASAHKYDIEVIDNSVFFYRQSAGVFLNEANLREAHQLIKTLKDKFHTRTKRYRDENVRDKTINIVAVEGARLKQGITPAAIIGFIFIILYIFFITNGMFST